MMTTPQIVIAIWLGAAPVFDLIEHRKTRKDLSWWIGRLIGHGIGIFLIAYTLHWGGFW